ncbi:MAG: hypothetical protein JST12_08880 [Armatimonadetes bacterium]|nr:hypothetical protein [Armatimonadota bacterium]
MIARSIFAETGNWGHKCALIGGLIPSLIVKELPPELDPHKGTTDVDIAIKMAASVPDDPAFYKTLKNNLASLGLKQDEGSFRWIGTVEEKEIIVELFVQVDDPEQGGKSQKKPVEGGGSGLQALGVYGLQHMELDIIEFPSKGELMNGKGIKDVTLRICGPAMLICLKAWALEQRTKEKDGYDVVWMLNAYGPEKLADHFKKCGLAETDFGKQALDFLQKTFESEDHTGPIGWVIESEFEGDDVPLQKRRAVGLVQEFLTKART